MWFYLYVVGIPLSMLLAALPLRRARKRALLGRERERYAVRTILLAGWALGLLVILLYQSLQENEVRRFWLVVCGPGIAVVTVRLAIEAKHLRKVFL